MNIIYDLKFDIEAVITNTNSLLIALIANQPNKQIGVSNWTVFSGSVSLVSE